MNRRSITLGLAALLAVAAPMWPGPVEAAPSSAGQSKGRVDLRVHVIHATSAHSRIDPRLEKLQRYLRHLRYTGYDLLETHNVAVGQRSAQTFTIASGRKVSVQVLSRTPDKARMRVRIIGRNGQKLLDTTVAVPRNGTFIVAGPKYKDGILVLPLTARY